MTLSLKQLGEFGWIDRIRRKTKVDKSSVLLGIGDDAAVIRTRSKYDLLLTTDMLIENKHFKLSEATPYEIGRKALGVNISDIAAMGGIPRHALISAGFPARLGVKAADAIYKGIRDLAAQFKVNIVGGDTNQSDRLVLSVALTGEVPRGKSISRAGAKDGDILFVTGFLGGSYASRKHLNFTPRVKESRFLVKNFNVHAMMDVSDGLSSDLHRMAKQSGVGMVISREDIPRSGRSVTVDDAMNDGEDFELLFALSPKDAARLTLKGPMKGLAPFHPVGRVTHKKYGLWLQGAKKSEPILERGFNHFNV